MPLLDPTELSIRPVSVRASELVYLRHLLEASEGLGFVVGNKGGNVFLVSTHDRVSELDEFIRHVQREIELHESMTPAHQDLIDEYQ